MNEQQWLTTTSIEHALLHVETLDDNGRKLDSFALACCQRVAHLHSDPRTCEVVAFLETTSLFDCGDERFEWARDLTEAAGRSLSGSAMLLERAEWCAAYAVNQLVRGLYLNCSEYCRRATATAARGEECPMDAADWSQIDEPSEQIAQLHLLRCIVGNPFRPVAFNPAWRTETAVALAAGIYAERAFDRLPILADALEEAGCDHPDVLAHCRGPDPHARGCWVVDGVLGKS